VIRENPAGRRSVAGTPKHRRKRVQYIKTTENLVTYSKYVRQTVERGMDIHKGGK